MVMVCYNRYMNIFDNLNAAQRKAVTHKDGPLLIVAGAGTGKTTVVTQRIAWLVMEQKVATDHILALTFTEKAAGEMEERVDVLLPYGYVDLWISTFHSFCERVLKESAIEIGLPPDFKLYNETDQVMMVRQNLDRFDLNYYRPLGNPTKFVQALVKHFSRAKDENVLPDEYLEYAKGLQMNRDDAENTKKKRGDEEEEISEEQRIKEVANAYHIYEQLLLESGALDFGDLILYTIKLFKTRPKILEKYREQFTYILVDEFQDTNYAQYELVKMLSQPKNNVTVVGDDDQSIYKFRGAAISNILEFKKDFPESKEVVLTENYRTKQNILDLSYTFIKQNDPNRLEYQLSKGKIDPKGAPLESKISKKLKSTREGEGSIQHLHYASHLEEAAGVVKEIVDRKTKNKPTRGGSGSAGKLKWSDFAILIRANSYANEFMTALTRMDVPHQFLASRGLYTQPEIMDVVAYLKLLDSYHESSAMWRVLNYAHWKLPIKDLMSLSQHSAKKRMSLFEACQQSRSIPGISPKTSQTLDKILKIIEVHTELGRAKGTLAVALRFMKDSGYLKHITEKESDEHIEKVVHLNQFFRKIEDFENKNDDTSVKHFLELFDEEQEAGDSGAMHQPWDEGPDAVKIMTVHAAKGLEFPYIFIVALVDKRFPSIERKDPIELPEDLIKEIIPEGDIHLQEERRLFYVAMTRARDGVFFTSADDYGGTRKKKLSRFLTELGFERKEGTEEIDIAERLTPPPEAQRSIKEVDYLREAIPEKASYTQLKAFETCPKQYKYAHILRVPVEGRFTFSFGKSMHNTLFHFFTLVQERTGAVQTDLFGKQTKDQGPAVSLEELMNLYDQEWIDEWYLSKEHREEYYAKGKESLRDFYTEHKNRMPVPLHLEQPFHLKLGDYTFKGVVDRIDPMGSDQKSVEIIDYKTGRIPKGNKLTPGDKEQLMIYDLAVREVFKLEPAVLSYYYLENNTKLSFTPDKEDLEKLKKSLTDQIAKIHQSDFAATPGFWCNNCDFRDICEDRWNG